MDGDSIQNLIADQRRYFSTGKTNDYSFRREILKRLKDATRSREAQILNALRHDLGKPEFEGYLSEVLFLYEEIDFVLKNLHRWMAPKRVPTPLFLTVAKSRIYTEPKGVVLVVGPWNYPFQLLMAPLIAAVAAGNCVVLKSSELAPATTREILQLIASVFEPGHVSVVTGGPEVAQDLVARKWDHLFFTGGTEIGRAVMVSAAKTLTPVTLELGGKSPCIIDSDTDLDRTARRIAWGKFFNAGQSCVAPDYLLVEESVVGPLVKCLQESIEGFFGNDPATSKDYGRIISGRHFDRLKGLLEGSRVLYGGKSDVETRYFGPTIVRPASDQSKLMSEEIFGPILPIVEYSTLDEAIAFVKARPKPLALYVFSNSNEVQQRVLTEISFGGGCVNDTLVHLTCPHLPFGGIGDSGLGAYHGKFGFDIFSHQKSVVHRAFWFDPSFRYPPYGKRLGFLRRLTGGAG